MRKVVLYTLGLLAIVSLSACVSFGPKADKRISITIQIVGDDMSNRAITDAMAVVESRLEGYASNIKIEQSAAAQVFKIRLDTDVTEQRIMKLLTTRAHLEFYEVVKSSDMIGFLVEADAFISNEDTSEVDSLLSAADSEEEAEESHLLMERLQVVPSYGGICSVRPSDTALVQGYLRRNDVIHLLRSEKRTTKFLWSQFPNSEGDYTLYAVRTLKSGNPRMDGRFVTKVIQSYDYAGYPAITMEMNEQGAAIWEKMTGAASKNLSLIAIVIDNHVYSAPGVTSPIIGGRTEIGGDFTLEEAQDLASMIGAGAIPKVEVIQFDVEPLE